MPRIKECIDRDRRAVSFRCPGCGYKHVLGIEGAPPAWGFNGDMDRPTLAPSIHVKQGHFCDGTPEADCFICRRAKERGTTSLCLVCHSFVTDGRIQFLGDCTHALAGQTINLPEIQNEAA